MTLADEQLLAVLRDAHRRLDDEIETLRADAGCDQLALARLKKRKLRVRDEIERAADMSIPRPYRLTKACCLR